MKDNVLRDFIIRSLEEDLGDGDHSSLASIPVGAKGKAKLLVKEEGIIAGVNVAVETFKIIDNNLDIELFIKDGFRVTPGDIVFTVSGSQHSILKAERLVLNIMQRMSGIATTTRVYVEKLKGLSTKILDTRKTSPGMRFLEKEAVRIGGGMNHRMGLYDMIMLKDNHIDFCGGIDNAIKKTNNYLKKNNITLKIVIEARSMADVELIIKTGGVDRILLDNFNIPDTIAAVKMINGRFETESSGGITLGTLRQYGECGVDYISVGSLTHQIKSLDMSLKAV
jgi:nicotinate-nucleotide pyrophosphorylase (carboxylating)